MRKLIISLVLVSGLFGSCENSLNRMQESIQGIKISMGDKDQFGMNMSFNSFKFWSKNYIVEGCDKSGVVAKQRAKIIKSFGE